MHALILRPGMGSEILNFFHFCTNLVASSLVMQILVVQGLYLSTKVLDGSPLAMLHLF